MPYHVFARAEGFFYPPGDCDLETEEEILRDYCIPFLQGKLITIAGAKLNDTQIIALVVFSSNIPSDQIAKEVVTITQRGVQRQCRNVFDAIKNCTSVVDISGKIMKKARDLINGNIKNSTATQSSINISDSTFHNSPVTGFMDHSNITITVNKSEIENWLHKITEELDKNNVQNEELIVAIDTLKAALHVPKPSEIIIRAAIEMIKSKFFSLIFSDAWQHLMTNPPI
jgi:hypothetical protein